MNGNPNFYAMLVLDCLVAFSRSNELQDGEINEENSVFQFLIELDQEVVAVNGFILTVRNEQITIEKFSTHRFSLPLLYRSLIDCTDFYIRSTLWQFKLYKEYPKFHSDSD